MCSRKELKMSTDTTAGRERSNFLFSYAGAWCGSDLYVGLVTSILTDPTCGGATCTVSTPRRCHGYRTAGVWCQPQRISRYHRAPLLGPWVALKGNDRTSSHEVLVRFLEELARSSSRIIHKRENFGKTWETSLKLPFRSEAHMPRMSEFIRPLIEVPLHVRRSDIVTPAS